MQTLIAPPHIPYPTRYVIDPVAFFVALIGGPLVVTLCGFWVLFIPVFALILGGPLYLMVGTPVLLWYLRHHDGAPSDLAFVAFASMIVGFAPLLLIFAVTGDREFFATGFMYIGFGMVFAPLWTYVFAKIYHSLRRDFFAKPRPF
ncbi:hypothetical protein GGR95_000811 [Sulfitobacter undariae]|uniref:Uncharacterized protein n=1 Tax=Sulfitobacter undariae TaxID=1563671 RepID=A0A7W6H020_9RHOB|nr:hypothetical protein [Sulfitobacter undariae]MBB3993183.1 hypothetical protein [Sulfitobacter undariae]